MTDDLFKIWIPALTLVTLLLFMGRVAVIKCKMLRKTENVSQTDVVKDFVKSITNTRTGLIALKESTFHSLRCSIELKDEIFPFSLTPYMQKLNVIEITDIVMRVYKERPIDHDELRDVCRAVTIASAMFGFEIPLLLLALDNRTLQFYHSFKYTQQLRAVPNAFQYEETRQQQIEDYQRNNSVQPYYELFPIVSKAILYACVNGNYVGFTCYSSIFNRMNDSVFSRKLSHDEIRSVTTAFAALTFMQIPLSYVSLDNLALSLIQQANPAKPMKTSGDVVMFDQFKKKRESRHA